MAVILTIVYTKGLKGSSGIAIGGIVGLDIFVLAFISGDVNESGSFHWLPALLSGEWTNLWLDWTATFVGTSVIALIYRKKVE